MRAEIEKALILSEEMLENATKRDWSYFEQHQRKREEAINKAATSPAPPEAQPEIARLISEIEAIDKKIAVLVEEQRSEAQKALQKQQKANRAISAYQST